MTFTDPGYSAYLKAWWTYLDADQKKDRVFFDRLLDWLRTHGYPDVRVVRWPMVWPSVEWLFDTRDRFTEAVEFARGG